MYVLALYKGIPIVLIPVIVIVLVYSYILNNTVIGRQIYAIGGNMKAAYLSGINVKRTLIYTYVNMAFLSAVAGMVFTARINAASPKAGLDSNLMQLLHALLEVRLHQVELER
jgi:putative multiple sugar transport system permease protein